MAGIEPFLDTGAVVSDAGAETDGRFHNVHGDWAFEEGRNCEV